MDRLKRSRRPLRTHLTRLVNESTALLNEDDPDRQKLQTNLILLEKVIEDLQEVDEKIKEQQLDDDAEDAEIEAEYTSVQAYVKSYVEVKQKIEKLVNPPASPSASEHFESTDSASVVGGPGKKRAYQLPTISLKPFDGTLGNWLSWWSQFTKIHEDEDLDAADKFQYLSQAIMEGTEAKELVNSYPHSGDNYPKVVEALTERYGRDDLQLQYYVRELLTLVITNVTKKEKLPLPTLFLKLESHLRCLSALKLDSADPATWLFPLVESSLGEDTLRAWQRSSLSKKDGSTETPKKTRLDFFMDFVKGEVRTEQEICLAQTTFQASSLDCGSGKQLSRSKHTSTQKKSFSDDVATAAGLIAGVVSCAFCEGKHDSDRCIRAQTMTFAEKREKLDRKKLCYRCLRPGHITKKCKWTVKCIICGGHHFAIFCQGPADKKTDKPDTTQKKSQPVSNFRPMNFAYQDSNCDNHYPSHNRFDVPHSDGVPKSSSSANQCSSDVLLNTIIIKLIGKGGNTINARLVGDTGSQRSYIRKDVVQFLECAQTGQEWIQNVLFGGVTTPPVLCKKYEVHFISPKSGQQHELQLLERSTICGQLPKVPVGPWIDELKQQGIALSDVGSGCSNVDILLGSDYWGRALTGRLVQLSCGLSAVETIFGWTMSGRIPGVSSNFASSVSSMLSSNMDITQLWNLETLGIRDPIETKTKDEEEVQAVEHFNSTVSRDEDGRYVVALPWKCDKTTLPSNRHVAERRLVRATAQLKNQNRFQDYEDVFQVWEKEKFISAVEDDEGIGHYLPHRPVFKESSTTPVRPVYDASCRGGKGPSINDVMYTGPNLLELIPSLLIRFREKKIGLSADIRKAFQMVKVREEDQPFQKFLWWEDQTCKKIKIYQHHRVVFGMTCSPFLLASTINYHLSSVEDREFAEKLRISFYVDNCVSSVSNLSEYELFRDKAVEIMSNAGMDLRQWVPTISSVDKLTPKSNEEAKECLSLLGVLWDRRKDELFCDVPQQEKEEENVTKRKILSFVARIFDPIGFTAPAVLTLKLILQESVTLKCGWDEALRMDLGKKFLSWAAAAQFLREVKIPRHFQLPTCSLRQIHVFVDGSSFAYAAVIFLRTEYHGEVKAQLLLAKSRLAPTTNATRKATVPRLELMACLLGTRLATTVRAALDWMGAPFYFWSDSTTALAWIKRNNQWGTFVSNRVAEITKTTDPDQWRHVPGVKNPADLPSRGCSPLQLLQSRWWEGPEWLKEESSSWPKSEEKVDEEAVSAEKRKTATLLTTQNFPEPRFSFFRKNVAVWGWVRRFIACARAPIPQRTLIQKQFLTLKEMREAEQIVIRTIQLDCFPNPSQRIGGMIVKKDGQGILRVQTRLLHRPDKPDFLHPILLPKNHPLVNQLVMGVHAYHGHAGTQFLISKLREKYWILQTRRTIQRILRKCAICRRHQSAPGEVVPAPLPELRVRNSEAFETTGVDLAGPVILKDGTKAWIVLFTCAFYRCLHLDIVTSLSTEAFLGALERFISVYGRPNTIYSDNGTNFHGAVNIFRQLNWKRIEEESQIRQIQWIFNPPSAAWWGGWWERLVRSIKDLLKRMLGTARLSYDEFRTCLAGVCATINDRPLTVVTEDGQDLIPLTPAMFLRLRAGSVMPECAHGRALQKGYREMKERQMQLQDRFRKEYLSLLVQRGNEPKKQPLQPGDVVLVGADNRKRFQWPLGLILEMMPGRDGESRVAKVKTSRGVLIRPLQRLFPLEVSGGNEIVTRFKASLDPVKIAVEKEPATEAVRIVQTKSGRLSKRPVRYGQYFNF